MERIRPIDSEKATGKAAELLDGVQKKLGMTPNMMRTMAQSPAVLKAYLDFSAALAGGNLSARLREQIALVVSETNGCRYCLAAHSAVGRMVGLSQEEIMDSRRGESSENKIGMTLHFAHKLVTERGQVNDHDLEQARNAGLSDSDIAEIVANVALNLFTNYFNHVSDPRVDFPEALPLADLQERLRT